MNVYFEEEKATDLVIYIEYHPIERTKKEVRYNSYFMNYFNI